jgi:phage terminase large subunit GpA-like protein
MLVAPYADPYETLAHTAELVRPPRRQKPSDAAAKVLRNEKGEWDPTLAPMMLEPLDLISTREYKGIVFVGPARASKTFSLVLGGISYIVTCSPGDTLIVNMTQDDARDFSRTELDRCIRYSPELASRISPRAKDDNTFDKFFRSGMMVKLGWPAVSQLSSKTLKYVFLKDYDRPENRDDVDGEGPMWDLAAKRIETYMSRGKCVAESSPGEDLLDRNWKPSTPHEAPPVLGIMSLYNRGTRARWHWRCVHCKAHFEAKPGLGNFRLPKFEELEKLVIKADLMTMAEKYAAIACPSCGGVHEIQDRSELNRGARWVHEGQSIDAQGSVVGARRRTQIASYWLGGVAAVYQRWDLLILKYLQAVIAYVKTGDEGPLRSTTMTDQAMPYLPRIVAKRRSIDEYKDRLEEWDRGYVPAGVRFLIAVVDVQTSRFVVQVHGFGVELESWIVDRFSITASHRAEGERDAAISPGSYAEDWHVLRSEVIERTYPIVGMAGAVLPIQVTLCDSGGQEGVTQRAYEFWRAMRDAGHMRRFALTKGDGRISAQRANISYPDTRTRKGRDAGARGDVPIWLLNSNLWKDAVVGDLAREKRGPGYIHIPRWIDSEFFSELTAEERTPKGWVKTKSGVRNEAFDLTYMARAGCALLKAETIDWANPPLWAREPTAKATLEGRAATVVSIEDLARQLNG